MRPKLIHCHVFKVTDGIGKRIPLTLRILRKGEVIRPGDYDNAVQNFPYLEGWVTTTTSGETANQKLLIHGRPV
jgi:hypothetical protein